MTSEPRRHGPAADEAVPAGGASRGEAGTAAEGESLPPAMAFWIDWRRFGPELRTPLHAILGNVELLLDGTAGPLSGEARECLGEIQSASRQLSRHVQTLLSWSELAARDADRENASVDFILLLRDMRATTRHAPLSIEPPEARLVVQGDRFWLRTLVAEVLALGGWLAGPPAIRLERRADGAALDFSWRRFSEGEAGPLQVALIEAIARAQGAIATMTSHGLCLYWPAADHAGPAAIADVRGDRRKAGRLDDPPGDAAADSS